MKSTLYKTCVSLIIFFISILEASSQLTLTTVSDPLLGSTKIKGISQNQLGETLLLSGKNIYTFVNEVTDVYTCNLCNDIRDVAMVGDIMYTRRSPPSEENKNPAAIDQLAREVGIPTDNYRD